MIKIFVTDDHELYLEGICLLLNKQENIRVLGKALSGAELLRQLPNLDIDVLLLDVHLPDINEEDLISQIRTIQPSLRILYLTMMRGTRFIHRLMKYGVEGYLLKNAKIQELNEAIVTVAQGGHYYSREVNIDNQDFKNTITIDEHKVAEILSKREREILKLICREFSNAEIAAKLFLSISTVETHRKNLISKLGVNNTVGLVRFAIRNGLID